MPEDLHLGSLGSALAAALVCGVTPLRLSLLLLPLLLQMIRLQYSWKRKSQCPKSFTLLYLAP